MDLYIQVGVVFLFLTAFATFMFVYNEPVAMFTEGISTVNTEVAKTLENIKSKDINEFYNNPSVSGVKVETIIKGATAKELVVLLQTKNQQGLVVNYGYQLREDRYSEPTMSAYGNSGTNSEFEKRYVLTVGDMYSGGGPASSMTSKSYGSGAGVSASMQAINLKGSTSTSKPIGASGGTIYGIPHLMFANPVNPVVDSMKDGNNYGSTGFLYTDQIVKENLKQNDNFSYLDSPTSLFYLDRNGSYYSTVIVNANKEPIGIYIEEHGASSNHNVLGKAMLDHGIISSLY